MTALLNTILLVLAGLCLLGAIYYFVTGIRVRAGVPNTSYGVKRQVARQGAFASFLRGVFLFCLALIIFSILGIGNLPVGDDQDSDGGNDSQVSTIMATRPIEQTSGTSTPPLPEVTPTSPVATLTATSTMTPIPTDTPTVIIAKVNSPNGLWLREKPGGTQQLELIANGAELIVLDANEMFDNLEWQQVRTSSGLEGWVAAAFIVLP